MRGGHYYLDELECPKCKGTDITVIVRIGRPEEERVK